MRNEQLVSRLALPAAVLTATGKGGLLLSGMNEAFRSRIPLDWQPNDDRTVRETLPIELARGLESLVEASMQSETPVLRDISFIGGDDLSQVWTVSCGQGGDPGTSLLVVAQVVFPADAQGVVSERKEIDRNLDPGFDFTSCVVGVDGTIRSVTAQFAAVVGLSLSTLIGTSFLDLVGPSQRNAVSEMLGSWTHDQRQLTRSIRLVSSVGQMVSVVLTLLPGEAAEEVRLVLMDVSTVREQLIEAKTVQVELEKSNQAKSNFLAYMSHELRTPLNGIIGFSDMINRQILGPVGNDKYIEYAGDINFSAKHLSEIVNDILDMARVEGGRIELEDAPVDIEELLDEVVKLCRQACDQHGVRLIHTVNGRTVVNIDRRLFRQILINLVYNAIKFTGSGGIVSMDVRALANGGAAIVVNDTGTGIDSAKISEVLRPFVTLKGNRATALGTGLGLPLSKAFAELHGGKLMVNSELGSGTSVICSLPKNRVVYAEMRDSKDYRGFQMSQFSYDIEKFTALIDSFTPDEFDSLPYGVIKLDRDGVILAYNAVEGKFSGLLADEVIGKNYFSDIAPCTALTDFEQKYREGMESGYLNEFFDFVFNFPGRPMNVQIHLKSSPSHEGGWAFIHWV